MDSNEDQDVTVPFGKKWARRHVAKAHGFDKLNINLLTFGYFPKISELIFSEILYKFKLPESYGRNVLDQHFFDPSTVDPSFQEFSKFSVYTLYLFLVIPKNLKTCVKSIEIFQYVINVKSSNEQDGLLKLRSVLLSLGLMGNLKLPNIDIYEILNYSDVLTSSALIFGLSCTNLGSNDNFLKKLITLHIKSFQNNNYEVPNIKVPIELQKCSILSLGLLQYNTKNRCSLQLLLKEAFKNIEYNYDYSNDSSSLDIYFAAFSIGLIMESANYQSQTDFKCKLSKSN